MTNGATLLVSLFSAHEPQETVCVIWVMQLLPIGQLEGYILMTS